VKRRHPERLDHIRIVGNLGPHDAEALELEIRRLARRYARIKDLKIETTRTRPNDRSA
jgi:hypothetical protein